MKNAELHLGRQGIRFLRNEIIKYVILMKGAEFLEV